MQKIIMFFIILLNSSSITFAQEINRVDGTKISTVSLQKTIEHLMDTANVSGLCISVFNENKPVFIKDLDLPMFLKRIH
jgi:hypothetical protein